MTKQANQRESSWVKFKKAALLTRPLNTLSRTFVSADVICGVFDVDIREVDSYLLRFKELNRDNLKFLDINIDISADSSNKGIYLETSKYAGAVPIKSPKNSKYTVDLMVKGSYSANADADDMTRLLAVMGQTMLPEFHQDLKLVGESVKPPVFFECQNYIDLYLKSMKAHWTKFTNEIRVEKSPRSSTNWAKYALNCYDPNQVLLYNNKINSQSTDHKEWRQLVYVLDFCIQILSSTTTPRKTRRLYADKVSKLRKTYNTSQIEKTSFIPTHASDPIAIKTLKSVANIILRDASAERRSWRIDIEVLFERYIQFVFEKATKHFGWKAKANPHYSIQGWKPSWALNYLEPDLILQSAENQIVIDAKYKSHMLGIADKNVEKRKDAFREDLHQVLAYSSFNKLEKKHVILAYPFTSAVIEESDNEKEKKHTFYIHQTITNPFNCTNIEVFLLGLPFSNDHLKEIINEISELISKISYDSKIESHDHE